VLPPVSEPPPEPDLTVRALASGLAVGALLCIANLYMGLKTGLWDSGHVTASILAFALVGGRLSRHENNVAQTAACATGAVPAAAGLLGAVPALQLLGRVIPAWGIAVWGLALGILGIVFAVALRRRLLVEDQLPFPTGIATAEVIEVLHAGGAGARWRTRALLSGGAVGAVLGWFRDGKPTLVPGSLIVPGQLARVPLGTLGVGLSTSPLLWGVGMVVGPRIGLAMLAGSAVAWLALAPWLVRGPLRMAADTAALASWLSWPGTALLVGAALVTLLQQAGALRGALRDLRSVAADPVGLPSGGLVVAGVSVIVVIVVGSVAFDLPPPHAALALAISVVGATVCARSAGLTDISPSGPVGQLAQAVQGWLGPGRPALNIAAGSVVAGGATETGVLLWSLAAGRALRAPVRGQVLAAFAGCALGAMLCTPAYTLLARTLVLGSSRLPSPTGVQWKATGEIVARGLGALPPASLPAVAVATGLGLLLAILGTSRAARYVPSGIAVGIGMLVPFDYSLAVFCGAAVVWFVARFRPGSAQYGAVVGAGLIAGESLVGVLAALLTSFELL